MPFFGHFLLILHIIVAISCHLSYLEVPIVTDHTEFQENNSLVFNELTGYQFDPYSPLLNCSLLPYHSIWCENPRDNPSSNCTKWGGRLSTEVQLTPIVCHALQDIECFGNRTFILRDYPCLFYSGHYFASTLIYSILLGLLGVDRFCLGHIGTAIAKLLTLGGLGVWWIVDIGLLISGHLTPADGSSWMPYL